MKTAGVFRDLVDSLIGRAYDRFKSRLRRDLDTRQDGLGDLLGAMSSRVVTAARDGFRSDVERIAIFAVLFRTQADQARRMDAVDATFGVFLTALLVAGPLAFENAPTVADRWIAAAGFGALILLVGLGLFGISGKEPKADIALQLAADLRTAERGSYANLRDALNSLRADPFGRPPQAAAVSRGAAGAIARLIAQDRLALLVKRIILGVIAVGTLALAVTVGVRDVIQLPPEDRHGGRASTSRQAAPSDIRRDSANPGERRVDIRAGHSAASLVSFGRRVRRVHVRPLRPRCNPVSRSRAA
jgi:hypothetical protein